MSFIKYVNIMHDDSTNFKMKEIEILTIYVNGNISEGRLWYYKL